MLCPTCGHENVSDFPFCEACLTLLPARPGNELAFELDIEESSTTVSASAWPPFPWNPSDLKYRLFGRDKQLSELSDAWSNVLNQGNGRIHLLVSEFGMGKTQVTKRFSETAAKKTPGLRTIHIRCPERAGNYALWDILLRNIFDISSKADARTAGEQLMLGVSRYLPEEAREVSARIADLTGYVIPGLSDSWRSEEDEAIEGRSIAALIKLLRAIAKEPLIVVIAQANRSSLASLNVLNVLSSSLKERPAMIVLAGTPGLTELVPGWSRLSVTHLAPLTKKVATETVGLFLTGLNSPPVELTTRIVERAHGSPWAIKSLLHYLGEAGAISVEQGQYTLDESICWDLEWPEDFDGVVLARLNALSPRARAVLGNAAVVGKVFWTGALVALEREAVKMADNPGEIARDNLTWEINSALERLASLKFIGPQKSGLPGEECWGFRSKLHWRVAQTIVPSAAKTRLHRVAAQWLRMHAGDELDSQFDELARHAELSEDERNAAQYSWKAAQRALSRRSVDKALPLLRKAHELVDEEDHPTRFAIALDLGDALTKIDDYDEALSIYQEALHVAWQLRHRVKGANALARIGRVETQRGQYEQASRHFEAALRLYEERGDRKGVATVCLALGKMFWLKSNHKEALQSYRKSERLYAELDDKLGLAEVADAVASLQFDRGDLTLAERYYKRALRHRRALGDQIGVTSSLNNLGAAWLTQGKRSDAITVWTEAMNLATVLGQRVLKGIIAGNLGEVYLGLEDFDSAKTHLDNALAWATEADSPRAAADIHLNRASLFRQIKEYPRAEIELEVAKGIGRSLALPRLHGLVERACGDHELAIARENDRGRNRALRKALKHYRRSVDYFADASCDLENALSRERIADVLQLSGQPEDAELEREVAASLRNAANPGAQQVSDDSLNEGSLDH